MVSSSHPEDKKIIWVTRPEPQASVHANQLQAQGFGVSVSPVLTIKEKQLSDQLPKKLARCAAVLISSLNAIKYLPSDWINGLSNKPVVVSGAATFQRATELGFANVHASPGQGSEGMVSIVRNLFANADKVERHQLLYLAGTPRTPLLETSLANDFDLVIVETYEAVLATELTGELRNRLHLGHIAAVTLFSSRSAMQAAKLLQETLGAKAPFVRQTILSVCISPAVEQIAKANGFQNTLVSDLENSESVVIKLVDQLNI